MPFSSSTVRLLRAVFSVISVESVFLILPFELSGAYLLHALGFEESPIGFNIYE